MMPNTRMDTTETAWLAVASIDQDIAADAASLVNSSGDYTNVSRVEVAHSDPVHGAEDPAGADPGDSPVVPARPASTMPQPNALLGNGPRFSSRRTRFRIPR